MDTQPMTQPDFVRKLESKPNSTNGDYVAAYVRDRFSVSAADTAKTIARLAGLGEEGARQ